MTEAAAAGTDTVQSSDDLHAGRELRKPDADRPAPINGTGNTLANILTGNSGANTLNGGRRTTR